MGVSGSREAREDEDIWWTNGDGTSTKSTMEEDIPSSLKSLGPTEEERDISLNQLSENLNDLKEKRKAILAAKKKQFEELREEVRRLTEENQRLKSTNSPSQEEYTKELKQLQHDNEHLRLLLSSKQSGGVLLEELEKVLQENTTLKCELKEKLDELRRMAVLLDTNRELKINIAEMQSELQDLNSVVVEFEKEREEYRMHVVALKDVIAVSKKMLLIRESQLKELREKVESIEETLSGKEMNILSQDLRLEYERQLQSIRNLRALYEDRQRTDHKEKEQLNKIIEETKKELESEQNKNKEAEARISELEEINSQKYDQIKSLESNLGLSKAECRQYQAELTVINQLFSEILLGFNSTQEIDLDKLTKHLEDHRDLLQNIVINELTPESSFALPKILLDLVNQVSTKEEIKRAHRDSITQEGKLETIIEESESQTSTAQINSAEEIVELLPKVWRVLIELLSHHKAPINILTDEETTDEDPCYKTVQTPKGPSLVLSVSQTFIRLKDLILEKKSLEKETGHLKQLNTHLESRLQDQEKRLSMVSSELNKTWHVVGKLQKQHQLLHTQEKILRYELAQKRKLLTTLKEELEYSREKWQEAREKNSKTEKQWKQLRGEFAARRRTTLVTDECNTSQESGYSDERASSSDDEPGYETDVSECALASKQTEDPEEGDQISKLGDLSETVTQLVDHTEADSQITPISSHQEEPLSDDNINSRVSLAENVIEMANNAIESRIQVSSQKSDLEASSLKIKETSFCIVSSVIEEAIASIFRNADETRQNEPLLGQTEEQKTENTVDYTEKTGLHEDILSGSNQAPTPKSLEEILAAKEERLRRLEGQCDELVEKVTNTTQKSVMISNKLDNLHEAYGESSSSNTRRKTPVDDKEKTDETRSNNQE